ncbi:MAG: ABC transporter permease [Acidobacteria bacterium]|nr:ABC transporter permease [Acidobacteriota bacterium]
MGIPLAYNLRNLRVRKTTTLMTALGIALTVAVLLAILALVGGLRTAFRASGSTLQILVLRKGSDAELSSGINLSAYRDMKFKSGIARAKNGEPLVSYENIVVINLPSVDNPDGSNVTLRGLPPAGVEMRDGVRLTAGRWFESGKREVVAGKAIAARFPGARIGQKIRFGRGDWEVVGVMDAAGSAANSELWGEVLQVGSDFGRTEAVSSVLIRAVDEVAAAALINDLGNDQRLNVAAQPEKSYYEAQTSSGLVVQFLGFFISAVMAIGSGFAAANTMYAAVARRAREIGTLRVLGFSRGSILLSFLLESLLLSLVGGILGCLLVLPLNGITTGMANNATFSEIAFNFRVSPGIMLTGIVFALVLGAMGGLFPARNAANKEILIALREV